MSISIAIAGIDGIVLATDSRVTVKNENIGMLTYRDVGKKLWVLKKGEIVAGLTTVSTNRGLQEWLVNHYINEELPSLPNRRSKDSKAEKEKPSFAIDSFDMLTLHFSNYLKGWINNYVTGMPQQFVSREGFTLGFTLAGYDAHHKPQIHFLHSDTSFSPDLKQDYVVSGIPFVCEYWMLKLWKNLFGGERSAPIPKAKMKTLKRLAVMLIRETAKFNSIAVGGKIQMIIIGKDGKLGQIGQREIRQIESHAAKITNEDAIFNSMATEIA